ncbi:MFS transporter [Methyloversatilis thermotolerans]|uniref:MFS transporter n=1 Tax=Methyloversatilis thermotolerans TaxID=1346290 RepID=UPI00058D89DA|nr:MFS transporter [Methyloversatilis thermotolerans]
MTSHATSTVPEPIQRALRILSLAYFVQVTGALSVVGCLAAIAHEWSLADAEAAYLISAFGVTFALAAPLMQVWIGHFGRRRQLLIGLAVFAASCFAFAFAPGYGVLLASRVLMGLGAALISPVLGALGTGLVSREHQGSALATVLFGLSVASLAGMPAAAWIADGWGPRWLFVGVAVATVLTAAMIARFVPDAPGGERIRLSTVTALLSDGVTFSALCVVFFIATGVFATYAFLAPIIHRDYGADAHTVTLTLLVSGVAGVIGNLYVERAARRYSAEGLLLSGLLMLGADLLFLLLAPQRIGLLYGALIVWAVATAILWPTQQRRVVELKPELRGIGLALTASFLFCGIGFGSAVAGWVYPVFGYAGTLCCSLLFLSAALAALRHSVRGARARALSSGA